MDAELDLFAPEVALDAPEPLGAFNRAGVLDAADIRVATVLCQLAGVTDPDVLLAVALAVRAPRLGHVFVDLASVSITAASETEGDRADGLPWPAPPAWVDAVAGAETFIGVAGAEALAGREGTSEVRPLRIEGSHLYLDRYWRAERRLAGSLAKLADSPVRALALDELRDAVVALFPDDEDVLQRTAAASAALRRLTVIAGGPGTGKTTTVARIATLLTQGAADAGRPSLIALCAPTGKAAARLQEELPGLRASTIHRLLGWRPGGRWRYDQENRLPHDVVIVDEASMVPLVLMDSLVAALRSDAQLILVGDPDQLTAVEAGAVLRDIVGPAAKGLRMGAAMRALVSQVTGSVVAGADLTDASGGSGSSGPPGSGGSGSGGSGSGGSGSGGSGSGGSGSGGSGYVGSGLADSTASHAAGPAASAPAGPDRSFGDGVVVLRRGHRFGEAIQSLADAIRRGDADGVLTAIASAPERITWLQGGDVGPLRELAVATYGAVAVAARAGDAVGALRALGGFRLLCVHRRGPYGVRRFTGQVEEWLAEALPDLRPGAQLHAGAPLLVTENDHELRLSNGDTGVIVSSEADDGALMAAFEQGSGVRLLAPARLAAVESLYAMTVHKSQGSQFEAVAVVLPEPGSPLLTRELLYTAVTRTQSRLLLIGSEESVRTAVERPIGRATGLQDLLWGVSRPDAA